MNKFSTKCIVCRAKDKRQGSLFCKNCLEKDIFVKIKSWKYAPEYKSGWTNSKDKYGRIPSLTQRTIEKPSGDTLKREFGVYFGRNQ